MSGKPLIIPTLTEKGYVEGTKFILAQILSDYILTDAMQSLVLKDALVSLPLTYKRYINDPPGMAEQMKIDLERLINRHGFEHYEIEAKASQGDEIKTIIFLYLSVIDDTGNKVSLGNVLGIDPNGLDKVIEINNYGDGLSYL